LPNCARRYSGTIIIIPNNDAGGRAPENTYIRFDIGRNVITSPTLSFYKYSLEKIDKEEPGIENWTVSGSPSRTFTINTSSAFAENLPSFGIKTNVLHIKPTYNSDKYSGFLAQYDLSEYAGKKIEIEMSMDVYLTKPARVAWQVNSTDSILSCDMRNCRARLPFPRS